MGIFLIQGSKPLLLPLLHCQACSLPLVSPGKPRYSDSESESCLTLCDQSMDFALQCMGFSRPESWSGEPFPSPGDLPNPGIKPRSPALQAILYQLSHKGSPFPVKSLALSACVSLDNSFPSVRQEVVLGPWKGLPFLYHLCNHGREPPQNCTSLLMFLHSSLHLVSALIFLSVNGNNKRLLREY